MQYSNTKIQTNPINEKSNKFIKKIENKGQNIK